MTTINKLYIIGNGFDLHHGIKSRYSDFQAYVEKHDEDLYDALEKYFDTDLLWSDFEQTLADLDTDTITDDASDFLVSYGADDWSDANHHDYQFEIQRVVDIVTKNLKNHFTNWVLQLDIIGTSTLKIHKYSIFLTFNYTQTLEKIYQISESSITYIHNKAVDQSSTLILGHGRKPKEENSFSKDTDEDTDPRVAQGRDVLDQYFEETYKNTATIIQSNKELFTSLHNIDEVFVLGHSMSMVDLEYFQAIKKSVSINAVWTVSYYGASQKESHLKTLADLGIPANQITLIQL
jgi:hypothetical protein